MPMTLTMEQEEIFRNVFLQSVDNHFQLPSGLHTGKVYTTAYNKDGNRGSRDMRFVIHEKDGRPYLDFYLIADDYSIHKRISYSGELESLENFEGQYGWPGFEDTEESMAEHQRIKDHNQKVYNILKQKGLEI